MDENSQERKQFLEEQLHWCKEQDNILREKELKLHEMKEIVESVLELRLSPAENKKFNDRFNELIIQVNALDKQLNTIVN